MSDTDRTGAYTDTQVQGEHKHVDTGAAEYAYHPMTRSTLVSFYCALKKQVLRFTSVYLVRAGYLFAFLFYPRKDRPLQYQDVGYCLRSTVRCLHSLPKSKGALFHFASEKKQHTLYFIPYFTF